MISDRFLELTDIPLTLLSHLDARDAALWVLPGAAASISADLLAATARLPWHVVLLENAGPPILKEIEAPEEPTSPLVRVRGYPAIIRENPSQVVLPPRALPILALDDPSDKSMGARLRRLSMLNMLLQGAPEELVVLASESEPLPVELAALWQEGFRSTILKVSDDPGAAAEIQSWRLANPGGRTPAVVALHPRDFCRRLVDDYSARLPGGRVIVGVRDVGGRIQAVDVVGVDDPQHPLLDRYEFLDQSLLSPVRPEDLTKEEVESFFRDVTASWRPFAAGMQWTRGQDSWLAIRGLLKRLDAEGTSENSVAYIKSEPGSGGTTLARSLAWQAASEGYHVLVARAELERPAAPEVSSFMTRVAERVRDSVGHGDGRLYEAPWLIVFDRAHWEGMRGEFREFVKLLRQSGRPACVLLVTGPFLELDLIGSARFQQVGDLVHEVPMNAAEEFGAHLNRFLAPHGATRSVNEWRSFFNSTAVNSEQYFASFWITLSFWLQRQIDLSETVQEWVSKQFALRVTDLELRMAIVSIAALSTERRSLPESLLPLTDGWPVSQRLEDLRSEIGALGLTRIRSDGERRWALAHDILGRYLLNAVFSDHRARAELGFGEARSPDHLRFLVLRSLTRHQTLGWPQNRWLAEDFAVNIFKIDPDHGRALFALYWEEALAALDEMPKAVTRGSRTFLHHTSISRRRIAKDTLLFPLSEETRVELLERAAADTEYAVTLPRGRDDESDLNLYNTLARTYQDLVSVELARGAGSERVEKLRGLGREATRAAYLLNPDSQFVIETYARSLLTDARLEPSRVPVEAIEVLNLVYSEMDRERSDSRRIELSRLAEEAVQMLMTASQSASNEDLSEELTALIGGVAALRQGVGSIEGMSLADFPSENRRLAIERLSVPSLIGNLQASRLLYNLIAIEEPENFEKQLSLVETLSSGNYPLGAQLKLEYAVLLFQRERNYEADKLFQKLRQLWQSGEHFVQVPDRLRWLLTIGGSTRRLVKARVESGGGIRQFARVREMADVSATFRPVEFGQNALRPGEEIQGYITFGHNGPFLRPLTAPHR